jgi:PPOX class probable F420-dependent enzyme
MTLSAPEQIADAQFVALTTFRKDGSGVSTPVWIAAVPDGLGVWTGAGTGKVTRIRRDDTVTLAVCDRRGRATGPAVHGTARLLDADGTARVRAAVRVKYGVTGKLLTTLSALRRGTASSAGIAITLD